MTIVCIDSFTKVRLFFHCDSVSLRTCHWIFPNVRWTTEVTKTFLCDWSILAVTNRVFRATWKKRRKKSTIIREKFLSQIQTYFYFQFITEKIKNEPEIMNSSTSSWPNWSSCCSKSKLISELFSDIWTKVNNRIFRIFASWSNPAQ